MDRGSGAPILLVSQRRTSFLRHYLGLLAAELEPLGPVEVLAGDDVGMFSSRVFAEVAPTIEEQLYTAALRRDARLVHVCFLSDPGVLAAALSDVRPREVSVSASIFGLSEWFSRRSYRDGLERLLEHDCVSTILIRSNLPEETRRVAALASSKLAFVHDPVYDRPELYAVDRSAARQALDLDEDTYVALYFGAYSEKKGADLLVAACERLRGEQGLQVLFAGSKRDAPPHVADLAARLENVRWDAGFVDDAAMPRFFAAADLVVLPYRRGYEHGTSGVLVQAALARRPVLVPDLSPFDALVREYGVGGTFTCEDADALARQLSEPAHGELEWGRYLARIESWADIAARLANAAGVSAGVDSTEGVRDGALG